MNDYRDLITQAIMDATEGLDADHVQALVEIPADNKMGDYAFPCFKLAKVMRKAPPLIAKDIAEKISGNPLFEKVEQVNAYVNIFISRSAYIEDVVKEANGKGADFGKSDLGAGKKVIVEYSSPNIA